MDELSKAFAEIINESNLIVLTCHVNADGDALGSTLAYRHVLMNMGKQAVVMTPDLAPTMYAWMPGFKNIMTYERQTKECDEILDMADLIIMMDFNDLSRIKQLGEKIASLETKRVLIDHHLDPQVSADLIFSAPHAAATCQIAYKLLNDAGLRHYIDTDSVSNLYTGIITDTGGLSYNSSDPELYTLIADMLTMGIDKAYIHDKIFNNKTLRRLKLQGYTLHKKLHRLAQTPICYMALSEGELEQFGYNTGDTEGFVNIPLQIKDISISCLIIERPDCIKMSFRSKGDFPVNEYSAKYFKGGGHLNAAGGTFYGALPDAINLFRESIVEFYKRWMIRTAEPMKGC